MTEETVLEIVWRNPDPPQRRQSWEQIALESGTARYLIREFYSTDGPSVLVSTSSLEVVSGGRAA